MRYLPKYSLFAVSQYINTFNWLFRIAHFECCWTGICCSVSALQILFTF